MTENRAHHAVQREWLNICRYIEIAESEMRQMRDTLTKAVGHLAELREAKAQLETHAAAQGWELKPPEPSPTISTVSTAAAAT